VKIAMDAQTLFEEHKTGIGWTIEKIITHMDLNSSNVYQLNYFAFRNKKKKRRMMEPYVKKGYQLKVCGFFPLGIYRRLWNRIPLPYSWFMGRDTDLTQFFNYVIPPGVKGKAAVYIYDMVYRACPETMEDTTRAYMESNVENSCKRADIIVTISEFSKNEIIKYLGVSPERIYVVPCGVDLSVYNPAINDDQVIVVKNRLGIKEPYYLYLGTLEPRKNVSLIIEAYRTMRARRLDEMPKLIIAGKKGWGYQELFEMVQAYGLTEHIIFTGYIGEEEKAPLLKGAVGFLFPSLYEGFGIPPLEAMACGTPVIVSNRASLPEVVGNIGLLVEPQDSELMAQYMELLLDDLEYRRRLSAESRKWAEQFTWEASVAKLGKVYQDS